MDYTSHGAPTISYIFSHDGTLILTNNSGWFKGWANSQQILKTEMVDIGDGTYELKAINVTNGSSVMLWPYSYADIAMSPDLNEIVVARSGWPDFGEAPLGLVAQIPISSDPQLLSSTEDWITEYWGSDRFEFAASSFGEGTFGIQKDRTLVQIDTLPGNISVAPGSSFLALYGPGGGTFDEIASPDGLRIFDSTGGRVATLSHSPVYCVSWKPDFWRFGFQFRRWALLLGHCVKNCNSTR